MVKAIWAVACSILVLAVSGMHPVRPAIAEERGGLAATRVDAAPIAQSAPPVQAAAPAPAAPTPLAPDQSYRLGAEDQLRISVWDNKELTLDLVVRPDGKISMPLIQDVVAEGMTASQLAEDIRVRLSAFIVNPAVSVIVLQVNAPKYYVIGYVSRPGTYHLRGDTSVLQALALAGGMTQFASPRSIKLIRNVGGRQEVRKINYYSMIDEGGEGNYMLRPGDTIVVP